MEKTLKELADYLGGEVIGDENIKIKGVMTIDEAREGYITFVSNIKYLKRLRRQRHRQFWYRRELRPKVKICWLRKTLILRLQRSLT